MPQTVSQWNWWVVLFLAVVILLSLGIAFADPPPPMQPDPISIDRASPSVVLFGNSTTNIYGEAAGGLAGGWDVGGPGPILHVFSGAFGLPAGPVDNVDGISNGEIPAAVPWVVYFSADDMSFGMPGTQYEHQAMRMQAAGDRFVTNGFTSAPIPAVLAGGGPATIVGPVMPGLPANLLSANQTRYNEIPTIGPPAFNPFMAPPGVTNEDDMDALELTPLDFTGDGIHDTPLYFTLDAISPSAAGAGGASIFVSPPGGPGFGLFAPFPMLGLVGPDEVDALALWDVDGDMLATPGIDYAIYSLAPGSPTLGLMGWSPADVLATNFVGLSVLYLPSAALGMLPTDNIDALDVEYFSGLPSIEIWDEIPEEILAADFEEDGDVDGDDLVNWQAGYGIGSTHMEGDADFDADVDGRDFLIWQRQYTGGLPSVANAGVPEPASSALFGVAIVLSVMMAARRVSPWAWMTTVENAISGVP